MSVTYGYLYQQNVPVFGDIYDCTAGCTLPVDRRLGDVYFQSTFLDPADRRFPHQWFAIGGTIEFHFAESSPAQVTASLSGFFGEIQVIQLIGIGSKLLQHLYDVAALKACHPQAAECGGEVFILLK